MIEYRVIFHQISQGKKMVINRSCVTIEKTACISKKFFIYLKISKIILQRSCWHETMVVSNHPGTGRTG